MKISNSLPSILLFIWLSQFPYAYSQTTEDIYSSEFQSHDNDSLQSVKFPIYKINSPKMSNLDNIYKVRKILKNKVKLFEKTSSKYTLETAINESIFNNPHLASVLSDIKSSEWKLIAAQRTWYPTINISGTPLSSSASSVYVGSRTSRSSNPEKQSTSWSREPNTYQKILSSSLTPTLSWTIFSPTRIPSINVAYQQLKAKQYLFETTARDLIYNTQASYYGVQANKQLTESYFKILDLNIENLEVVLGKYSAGYTSVVDVYTSQAQVFTSITTLIANINAYEKSSFQLSGYLGLPQDKVALPQDEPSINQTWKLPKSETIDYALANSEIIKRSYTMAETYRWNGIVALNRTLPTFTASLKYPIGWDETTTSITVISEDPNQFNNTTNTWKSSNGPSISLAFEWPIFDAGISKAEANSAFNKQKSALLNAQTATDTTVQNVRDSFSTYNTSLLSLKSSTLAYESAMSAELASSFRYLAGVGDVTQQIQATTRLGLASVQKANSIKDFNQSVANLYRYSALWPMNTRQFLNDYLSTSK